jgi:hypothetical protein
MRKQQQRTTQKRFAVAAAVAGIALAAYSSVPSTQPRIETIAAAGSASAYQDPSLAGLRPGPDAEAGGVVAEYY